MAALASSTVNRPSTADGLLKSISLCKLKLARLAILVYFILSLFLPDLVKDQVSIRMGST